jgi:hypothetical protein
MSNRKKLARLSRRKWNGNCGNPSGSTAVCAPANMALSATAISSSDSSAPAGNNTIATKRKRRSASTPAALISNQPSTTSSTQSRWTHMAGLVKLFIWDRLVQWGRTCGRSVAILHRGF